MITNGKNADSGEVNIKSPRSSDLDKTYRSEAVSGDKAIPPLFPDSSLALSPIEIIRTMSSGFERGFRWRAHRMRIGAYPDGDPGNQLERDYTRFRRSFTTDVTNANHCLREAGQALGVSIGDIQIFYLDAKAILAEAEGQMSLFHTPQP